MSEGCCRAREGKTLTKRQAGPNEAEHVSHMKEPEGHPKHKVKNREQFVSLWVVWKCEDTIEEVETTLTSKDYLVGNLRVWGQ